MINYLRFIADVDVVFNLPAEEKDPLVKPPVFDYSVTHFRREEENIDSLMRRLGEVTRKHKLLIKPFFQDKDIAKIGRVSFTRMRSILDNNKLPLTDHQYQLLCQNFSYENKEFNYVDFIEALKQYEAMSWNLNDLSPIINKVMNHINWSVKY